MAGIAHPEAGDAADARSAKAGPTPATASVRDEMMLKFVGTATLIVGLVILVAAVVGIAALSILRFDVTPWLLILPLALLVVAVGAGVNAHYRGVVERTLNPKPEPARPPAPPAFAAPYPAPYASPYPAAPGYPPPYMPAYAYGAPPVVAPTRTCDACLRPIPAAAKFCPYCRREYPA